jgi:hypothetical protein
MSTLYFVGIHDPADPSRDFGFVKVGVTDGDVLARLGQLQTGNPFVLRQVHSIHTPCAFEVEHFLHRTHAHDMKYGEWVRCSSEGLFGLVEEAAQIAHRFEERKAKERALMLRPSNGKERRPDQVEIQLHRAVRGLFKEQVPARLRRKAAKYRLMEATQQTCGIEGIIRVAYVPATIRFSASVAAAKFPQQFAHCSTDMIGGIFRWRKVAQPSHFVTENIAARNAVAAAKASADTVLTTTAHAHLERWTQRTAELERLHDCYLEETQKVIRLQADVAEIQTDLTIRLGEYDAVDPICSYKRGPQMRFDLGTFCQTYPTESAQCALPLQARLRKHVFRSRSY